MIDLARAAVTKLAPEELIVFDPVSERCARDPEGGLAFGRTREDILGFGVDVVVPLLTPIAVAAASEVLRYLATQAPEALINTIDCTIVVVAIVVSVIPAVAVFFLAQRQFISGISASAVKQ